MRSPRQSRRVIQRYPILIPVFVTASMLITVSYFFADARTQQLHDDLPYSKTAMIITSPLQQHITDIELDTLPNLPSHPDNNNDDDDAAAIETINDQLWDRSPIIDSTAHLPTHDVAFTLPPPPPPSSSITPLTLDIMFHRLSDPIFHLLDSGLSDDDILSLIRGIQDIYVQAGIKVRIDPTQALTPRVPDRDRLLAYLFYVVGHPIIRPNSRRTQILGTGKVRISKAYSSLAQICVDKLANIRSWSNEAVFSTFMKSKNPLVQSRFTLSVCARMGRKCDTEAVQCLVTVSNEVDEQGEPRVSPDHVQHLQTHLDKMTPEAQLAWFAYQHFYFQAGLSWPRLLEFVEAMQSRPMLFLHYAIGRDVSLTNHDPVRTQWEHANIINIYAIPMYHDMNARGSTVFMDVVFRTTSCWAPTIRNLTLPLAEIPIPCRWGVRPWEKHEYTVNELARMVSHELGHCLSLEHIAPKCHIYSSTKEAPLMQQQRVLALQSWVDKQMCTCVTEECGTCECEFNNELFAGVGESRALNKDEIALVRKNVAARDVWSSAKWRTAITGSDGEDANSITMIGYATENLEDRSETAGALLIETGSRVLFWEHPSTVAGWITAVRWKASFAHGDATIAIRILSYGGIKSSGAIRCDRGVLSNPPKFTSKVLTLLPGSYGKHVEFQFTKQDGFTVHVGDMLAVELVDKNRWTRIRFAQVLADDLDDGGDMSDKQQQRRGVFVCDGKSGVGTVEEGDGKKSHRKPFMFNFDVVGMMAAGGSGGGNDNGVDDAGLV